MCYTLSTVSPLCFSLGSQARLNQPGCVKERIYIISFIHRERGGRVYVVNVVRFLPGLQVAEGPERELINEVVGRNVCIASSMSAWFTFCFPHLAPLLFLSRLPKVPSAS